MVGDFQRSNGYWVIIVSFILAGLLVTMPFPEWLDYLRPQWAVLIVIYWVMALPHKVGLLTAWIAGFYVDILEGSLLGVNALVLSVVAYLVLSLYQRLRMFTLIQQSGTVLILVGINELLSFWILAVSNQNTSGNLMFMVSALSSALVWPFVFFALRRLRRYFHVN